MVFSPKIEHVEPENDAFQKRFPFRGRLLFRFHVKFQGCKVDFALLLYGNGFAPFFVFVFFLRQKSVSHELGLPLQNATIAKKGTMGLLGPSWINRRLLFPTRGGK